MKFDATITVGQVAQIAIFLITLLGIGLKYLRVLEGLTLKLTFLTDAVNELRGEVKILSDKLHGIERRVTVIETLSDVNTRRSGTDEAREA